MDILLAMLLGLLTSIAHTDALGVLPGTVLGISERSPTPTVELLPTQAIIPTFSPSPRPTVTLKSTPVLPSKKRDPLLISEVNEFRKSHAGTSLTSHSVLCTIAQSRVNELLSNGKLDSHAGFEKHTETMKTHFSFWGETIYASDPPTLLREIVFSHWGNSTRHRATLLANADFGCGAVKGGFAVFLVGKKK